MLLGIPQALSLVMEAALVTHPVTMLQASPSAPIVATAMAAATLAPMIFPTIAAIVATAPKSAICASRFLSKPTRTTDFLPRKESFKDIVKHD
mmetsp:Transcript_23700/g.27034  ORF Transcript_23700/g.27034 Transcript_23700/m.27034 type:complete len:93 (+) Transcript_23700:95-373(+)